jgi:hypothetical protein
MLQNNQIYTSNTKNLELPPTSAEMLWGFLDYNVIAGGEYLTNLARANSNNSAPIPQSIIVDTTGMTAGSINILWDLNDLNYPIEILAGNKQSFLVPAKVGIEFSVTYSADAAGTLTRIDLTNFPQIPMQDMLSKNQTAGSNVNVTNGSTNPASTQPIVAGAPVSDTNPMPVISEKVAIGTNGNAWLAVAVAAAGVSATVDTLGDPQVSVYGSVSAATNISVNVSADGVTWWPSTQQAALTAAGDFYLNFATGARYLQLVSSAAATVTATISAK